MAYPLIGNYGIAKEDFETKQPSIGGLAVRDYNDIPSNFRSAATLDEVMKQYHIPGIYGIDTRKLVRKIRDFGSCKALLTDAQTSPEEGLKKLAGFEIPKDAVEKVSSKEIRYCAAKQENYLVAAIDCGIKENIIRSLMQEAAASWYIHGTLLMKKFKNKTRTASFCLMDRQSEGCKAGSGTGTENKRKLSIIWNMPWTSDDRACLWRGDL